ncbi:MAG: ABC transporter substrate-binding protein [Acidimicrobiales bacterium]
MTTKKLPVLTTLLMALLGAACGDDATPAKAAVAPAGDTATASFPVTITNTAGPVTIATRPQRVVSITPTGTEMLFALGAGPKVVAVDDFSNFPAGAPKTALSGFNPNVEAIAAYKPDLVVANDDRQELVSKLGQLKIPTLLEPSARSLDDSYAQIAQLGQATGHVPEATAVVARMKGDIAALVAGVVKRDPAPTYFHELDDTLYTATSKSFIGQIYALAGLRNIADDADDGSGFPQLTAEALLKTDPDFIFLGDTKCCRQTPETVAARPGFASLAAVKQGRVVGLDDDIASRWGPRVVELLRVVTEAVARFAPPVPVG